MFTSQFKKYLCWLKEIIMFMYTVCPRWLGAGMGLSDRPSCMQLLVQHVNMCYFPLQNEARKLNHQEVVEEDKRLKLPANWEAKKARLEWELTEDQKKKVFKCNIHKLCSTLNIQHNDKMPLIRLSAFMVNWITDQIRQSCCVNNRHICWLSRMYKNCQTVTFRVFQEELPPPRRLCCHPC